jgi:hypothetical protein
MVLEAIEDHERGWRDAASALCEERVARGKYAIEHILPRKWQTHWALPDGITAEERDSLIDTIGNLPLLTGKLNSTVSNGPWDGPAGKGSALKKHSVLKLNQQPLEQAGKGWEEEGIRTRGEHLIDVVLDIWTVPAGHRVEMTAIAHRPERKVTLADLIGAGMIDEGAMLHAPLGKFGGRTATVLSDGALDVNGLRHATPSAAARAVTKTQVNGWSFWLVDVKSKRSLKDLMQEYVEQRGVDPTYTRGARRCIFRILAQSLELVNQLNVLLVPYGASTHDDLE